MRMRALRTSWAAAVALGFAPGLVVAQTTPSQLLGFSPSQKGVEYDSPTDQAAIAACKVETVKDKDGKAIGFALRDGQGQLLRRFVDTNGSVTKREREAKASTHLDQWSYYKDGFEVYREIDANEDGSLDEIRWLNTGGTRVGVVQGGKIVAWKRLSAEEATRTLVQSITLGDVTLLGSVLATAEELETLGLPRAKIVEAAAGRNERLRALVKALRDTGWNDQTVWYRFDGQMPHVIPADAGAGLKGDITLYENAAVFAGPPNGQGNPLKNAYLHVPELVKLGEVWKFVDLPLAVDPEKPAAPAVAQAGIRAMIFAAEDKGPNAPPPALAEALEKLAQYDSKNALGPDANSRAAAEFHRGRIALLQAVVKVAAGMPEQLSYEREIVNSLAAAYQTGHDPASGAALDKLVAGGGKLGAYADYRKILSEYGMEADKPEVNLIDLQKKFLDRLASYLKDHPEAEEVPDVLFQLASGSEFNAEEKEARDYYARLAKDHPNTDAGKKAAGALKRLDLVDQSIDLSGTGLDGKKLDAKTYRGKHLLIVFWSSEASQFKNDLAKFVELYRKHQGQTLEVIGVNLDSSREAMEAALRDAPQPWPQIFEEGGMDSRLANEYGILTLPTMFLVDPQGKVVSRALRSPADLERYLDKDKPLAEKPVGLRLGVKP